MNGPSAMIHTSYFPPSQHETAGQTYRRLRRYCASYTTGWDTIWTEMDADAVRRQIESELR